MLKPEVFPCTNLHNSLKIGQIKMICKNYNNPSSRNIKSKFHLNLPGDVLEEDLNTFSTTFYMNLFI